MKFNKHKIYLAATLFSISTSLVYASDNAAITNEAASFVKLKQKANFIVGDNLVTDQLSESEYQAMGLGSERTLDQRAAGMSTVMVTHNGDMMESTVSAEDVLIFEQAIEKMKKSGHLSALFTQRSRVPSGLNSSRKNSDLKPENGSGDVTIESVIGTDDREQITNTITFPNYYIGRIDDGCTGTLITPKHVLTAGHCVANGYGSWYSNLNFSAAQNGSNKPFGTESWTNALTTSAWFNNRDSNFDYALIVLANEPHGGNAGFGLYGGGTHRVTGYPGDKPYGTMWTDSGSTYPSGSYRICYTMDTSGGQSGSSIFDTYGVVEGIHTTGSSTQNCGTKMTYSVYETLLTWIAANP